MVFGSISVVLAALLLWSGVHAKDGSSASSTASAPVSQCTDNLCFGIDWREPALRDVAALAPTAAAASGLRPVHYAVSHCVSSAVLHTMARSATDFNFLEPASGMSPLAMAGLLCPRSTFETLLFLGADPNIPIPRYGTVLNMIMERGLGEDYLRALVRNGADLNRPPHEGGLAPILQAVINKDLGSVKMLLAAGADPNLLDSQGATLAHYAAGQRNIALLRDLLKAGADFSIRDKQGRTPVFYSANLGLDVDTATIYAQVRAELNLVDNDGRAPVHYAAAKADAQTMAVLIALGARYDFPDRQGGTPLAYALRRKGDSDLVAVLLKSGADPNWANKDGVVPVMLVAAQPNGNKEIMVELAAAGADLEVVDEGGRTVLHIAVVAGNAEIAAWLLSQGADPIAEDLLGQTPEQMAFQNGIGEPARRYFETIRRERLAKEARQKLGQKTRRKELEKKKQEQSAERDRKRAQRKQKVYQHSNSKIYERQLEAAERNRQFVVEGIEQASEAGLEKKLERLRKRMEKIDVMIQSYQSELKRIGAGS